MSDPADDTLNNRVRLDLRDTRNLSIRQFMWLLEHGDLPIRLLATPPAPGEDVTRPSVDTRLTDLDKRVANLERSAKSELESREEATSLYVGQVKNIPEIDSVYVFDSPAGLDIWTLHDSPDYVNVLDKISQIQVDLDRTFRNVFFDFNLLSVSEATSESLRRARLVYKRLG